MRISRFYIDPAIRKIPPAGETMDLPGPVVHHLATVLRTITGAQVILFDGLGDEYQASIVNINKNTASVLIEQQLHSERESPLKIILVQAVVVGAKMDTIIQKSVELGVSRIVPVTTERCSVHLAGNRALNRTRHWRGIVQSAAEQSGRICLPGCDDIHSLFHWVDESHNNHTRFVLQPDGATTLGSINECGNTIEIVVGPEGGLSESELTRLASAGYIHISLGRRILRTETAGPAALSAIQTLWGDF